MAGAASVRRGVSGAVAEPSVSTEGGDDDCDAPRTEGGDDDASDAPRTDRGARRGGSIS